MATVFNMKSLITVISLIVALLSPPSDATKIALTSCEMAVTYDECTFTKESGCHWKTENVEDNYEGVCISDPGVPMCGTQYSMTGCDVVGNLQKGFNVCMWDGDECIFVYTDEEEYGDSSNFDLEDYVDDEEVILDGDGDDLDWEEEYGTEGEYLMSEEEYFDDEDDDSMNEGGDFDDEFDEIFDEDEFHGFFDEEDGFDDEGDEIFNGELEEIYDEGEDYNDEEDYFMDGEYSFEEGEGDDFLENDDLGDIGDMLDEEEDEGEDEYYSVEESDEMICENQDNMGSCQVSSQLQLAGFKCGWNGYRCMTLLHGQRV